jgi:hypothetical protein
MLSMRSWDILDGRRKLVLELPGWVLLVERHWHD